MAKKLYYKIGEACRAIDIQPYVLRYWETEFPALSPDKSRSGQRVYSDQDLGVIRRIKELLYEEGYTIAGAKKKLEAELAAGFGARQSDSQPPAPEGDPSGEAGEPPSRRLDSPAEQGVERLRRGIRAALNDARELLALLDSRSARDH